MNARERFNATLQFEKPDRLPFMEFMFYWPETRDRWNAEGMPADADPTAYFGYDPFQWLPVDFNFVPAFEAEVLEEDDEKRIVRDITGVVKQEYKYGSAMPHYIEFPLTDPASFGPLKERLDASSPERYPANWDDMAAAYKNRDYPVGLVTRGLIAFFRDFMEFNHMSMTFLTDPEWIAEVMDFHTDFIIRLWERAVSTVDVDFIQFGEDMAFKTGPMVGPDFVREFMVPRYQRITSFLKDHGVRNIIVDSDGDIRSLIPLYLEGGCTGVLPLENNASCSPVGIREAHPKLSMVGGICKQTIALGGEAMEAEVKAKALGVGKTGGYIPSFDHSVHPGVSLEVYKAYLERLREYCEAAVQ